MISKHEEIFFQQWQAKNDKTFHALQEQWQLLENGRKTKQ